MPEGVTIEEVPQETVRRPGPPREVTQPAVPLALTDRPWAEIEREQKWGRPTVEEVPQEPERRPGPPVEIPPPATPLLLTDRPWAEIEQERDPRWQQKLHEISRGGSPGKKIRPGIMNRRERMLGGSVTEKRHRQLAEARVVTRDKELSDLRRGNGSRVRGKQKEIADEQSRRAAEEKAELAKRQAKEAADLLAKPLVEAKRAAIEEKAARATGKNVQAYELDLQPLKDLISAKNRSMKGGEWSEASELLDQINDESAKVLSYVEGLATAQDRITKLGLSGKQKAALRTNLFVPFSQAVRNRPRNDADAIAKLTALNDQLQEEEDKEAAKGAAEAAAKASAADRADKRNKGLWPGNNRAAAVIAEKTRATLGSSDEERKAVAEALDALKNNTLDHSWAGKWGAYHGNGEGNLPGVVGGGGYKEYYVRADGNRVGQPGPSPAGRRRLVVSDAKGFVYYSDNHYGHPNGTNLPCFVKVTDA